MVSLNSYKRWLELMKSILADGGPSFVSFAITNACNAKCKFCTFPHISSTDWMFVETSKAKETLDILYKRGIRYISFVGGEPMLHPALLEIVRYSKDKAS